MPSGRVLPAVPDPAELGLAAVERQALAASLDAYQAGDLVQALAAFPAGRQPFSDRERIYLAQLQLAVGQVAAAEQLLGAVPATSVETQDLANGLRSVI